MHGILSKILFYLIVTSTPLSHAIVLPGLQERAPAACSFTGIKNGGFETGGLSGWTFNPTYTNYGTATCQAVNSGAANSGHSAEMVTSAKPGDPVIVGTFSQIFTGCVNVNYSITWSLFQVKSKTTYSGNSIPSMSVVLYGPNGLSYTIAGYKIERTNFTQTGTSSGKTFQAGTWAAQSASLKFAQTGNWTLYFRTFSPSASSGTGTSSVMRIDNVVIKAT